MRLHRLSMTAFGPYPGKEVIDFDRLNEAGLFLLTGPTGAGKTSILDAVCFALYGVVPGERSVKTLRSHHATEHARPEIELDVTIGQRRLRICRSPEWSRPKKRGAGHTREHASATLIDLSGPEERLVSSRIAEIGHELGLVLGMSSEQFMQVVLLPQGEFATFLQASSDERQAVLQRLFTTQRFARIEEWMREHTRQLRSQTSHAERAVAQLLATIAHRAEAELPEALSGDPLGAVAQEAHAWAAEMTRTADDEQRAAALAQARAEAAVRDAEEHHQQAAAEATAAERRCDARAVLDELDRTEDDAQHDRRRLWAHDRAAPVLPMLRSLSGVVERRDSAGLQVERLGAALEDAGVGSGGSPGWTPGRRHQAWQAASTELDHRLGHLRGLLPREAALAACTEALSTARAQRTTARAEHDAAAACLATLPGRREQLVEVLTVARSATARLAAARSGTDEAVARHEAGLQLIATSAAHADLATRAVQAREDAADARDRHLQLLELRLRGVAAELAGQLTAGVACQVCGSLEHPEPALHHSAPVSQADHDRARAEAERLAALAEESVARADEATCRLRALEVASGGLTAAESATVMAQRRAELSAVEAAAARGPSVERELQSLADEEQRLSDRVETTTARCAELATEVTRLETVIASTSQELSAALGGHPGPLADLVAQLSERRALLDLALEHVDALNHLNAQLDHAVQEVEAAACERGFGSAQEAGRAVLVPEVVDRLRSAVSDGEERRRTASAVLADLDRRGAATSLADAELARESTRTALEQARAVARHSAATLGTAAERAGALGSLGDQLEVALDQWEPVRERHAVADSLSSLVRGMSADNQLQMRLSSYVLATRLDQVLAAANERLSAMRGQRYSLHRCGRVVGSGRAGLGLELLDEWTGESRSPATLSGGETFVVSLALALGLADVVTEESGGLRVETLFVDEGFGMLDPDTLDDVMDRIDALRAGGRTVGVVSHVSELRSRIPTQVQVSMGRAGSSVTVRSVRA